LLGPTPDAHRARASRCTSLGEYAISGLASAAEAIASRRKICHVGHLSVTRGKRRLSSSVRASSARVITSTASQRQSSKSKVTQRMRGQPTFPATARPGLARSEKRIRPATPPPRPPAAARGRGGSYRGRSSLGAWAPPSSKSRHRNRLVYWSLRAPKDRGVIYHLYIQIHDG
jgi:hypothetical protein